MRIGPISRNRKSEQRYVNYKKSKKDDSCDFCKFQSKPDRIIENLSYFWVVNTAYGYDTWDGCGVDEHLMLVPKRHIYSMSSLNETEKLQYMELVASYESEGYSIYSRASQNTTKSVLHQHTHFIKVDNRRKKWLLYNRKPHILLYK